MDRIGGVPGIPEPAADDRRSWYIAQADSLRSRNPRQEAASALAGGDCHILGIQGLAPITPGYEGAVSKYRFGAYFFPGTSDFVTSDEQEQYQGVAYEFAKEYNRVILKVSRPA